MLSSTRSEIDHHTIKLVVGVMTLSLASLTNFFADIPIQSISASYHEGGWSRDIFVGFLFAVSAFLVAYNGHSSREMVLSKIAAVAALGVALFPCECENYEQIIPGVHGTSAAVMFVILAVFCYGFYHRALGKGHPQAKLRAYIYAVCGITIVVSILVLAIDNLLNDVISSRIVRLTFYGECAGLVAFGVSWLTASRALPLITSEEEWLPPFGN